MSCSVVDNPCHLSYPKPSLSVIAECRLYSRGRGSLAHTLLCVGNDKLRIDILWVDCSGQSSACSLRESKLAWDAYGRGRDLYWSRPLPSSAPWWLVKLYVVAFAVLESCDAPPIVLGDPG